jgi:hypothetical protein
MLNLSLSLFLGVTMPRRRSSSLPRKRNSFAHLAQSGSHPYGVPVPEALHEAIEEERGNLSKTESLLGCLAISMEHETDPATAPYYPDVAGLARDLLKQSINRLDSLNLQKRVLHNKVRDAALFRLYLPEPARISLTPQ